MINKRHFLGAALLALLGLPACTTTTQVSLDYASQPGHVRPGRPDFTTRAFVDRRGMNAMELGIVRTQLGTPVEHVQTRVPVSDVVTNAFGYGLQTRGMLTSRAGSAFVISGEVLDLYCQLLVHPYGYARVRVTVMDANTGQILHSQVYTGERQSRFYVPGTGSPVPLLRDLTSGALQDVVDKALDDENMRARLPAY